MVQPKSRRTATEAYADTAKSQAIADATTKYGGLPARVTAVEAKNTAQDAAIESLEEKSPRIIDTLGIKGGFLDATRRATELVFDGAGHVPTPVLEAQASRVGIVKRDSPRTEGGFLDERSRETELVFDGAGQVPHRSTEAWSARSTPLQTSTRTVWGHSLARGTGGGASPWSPMLSALLGVPVLNRGAGGTTSAQIAARQGGKAAVAIVAGGAIPASGPVNLSINIDFMFGETSFTQPATLRGVPGILQKIANTGVGADCTFTRTTPGLAVPVPDGSPLHTVDGRAARSHVTYIWAARNDLLKFGYSAELAVERISRMVSYLTSVHKRVLILEEPPAVAEVPGHATRIELDKYNAQIRAAFPQFWVPVMTWLRTAEAATAAGITFTAQDQTDISNQVTPASFRVDTLHLSTAGNTALSRRLFTEELNRGWI